LTVIPPPHYKETKGENPPSPNGLHLTLKSEELKSDVSIQESWFNWETLIDYKFSNDDQVSMKDVEMHVLGNQRIMDAVGVKKWEELAPKFLSIWDEAMKLGWKIDPYGGVLFVHPPSHFKCVTNQWAQYSGCTFFVPSWGLNVDVPHWFFDDDVRTTGTR